MSVLGDRLKQLRKQYKLTQEEVSEKLGLLRGTYSNYENGSREPDLALIKKFARFYEVSVHYLIGEEENEEGEIKALINLFKSLETREHRNKFLECANIIANGIKTQDRLD